MHLLHCSTDLKHVITALHEYKSTNLLQYWIKSYSTPATKYWIETGLSTYYSTGQIQEHFNILQALAVNSMNQYF